MLPINAFVLARSTVGLVGGGREMASFITGVDDLPLDSPWWYIYAGICCFLVLFAGLMSGLTLGLMSLGLVDLEILQQGGTPTEKRQAGSLDAVRTSLIDFVNWVPASG